MLGRQVDTCQLQLLLVRVGPGFGFGQELNHMGHLGGAVS